MGDPYTWRNNHHVASSFTKERFDHDVANSTWRCMFPMVRVVNGDPRHSDHMPVIIDVGSNMYKCFEHVQPARKFEAKWLEEKDCQARLMESWGKAIEECCRGMMEI